MKCEHIERLLIGLTVFVAGFMFFSPFNFSLERLADTAPLAFDAADSPAVVKPLTRRIFERLRSEAGPAAKPAFVFTGKLRLLGVIPSSREAVLEDLSAKETIRVREGSLFGDGYRVKTMNDFSIILEREGEEYVLNL